MLPSRVAVVAGARTPFTKAGTVQKRVPAHELGRIALREALERADLVPGDLDEVIFGNIAQPPEATNIARVIALRAGCPADTPAYTVNRNCGSALQALADGVLRIRAGVAGLVGVGGTESMSRLPLFFAESASGKFEKLLRGKTPLARARAAAAFRPADLKPVAGLLVGLTDYPSGLNMGQTAEVLAREFRISREAQDDFALRSHRLASAAQREGRLAPEITPVPVPPEYDVLATEDVGIRHDQSLEALAKLPPVFDRRFGTVTAGNSSQITDGAAALVLASEHTVRERSLPVLGWVRSFAFAGLDPRRMGLGPAYATPAALREAGVDLRQVGLVEMNEAFAAQVLANEIAFASAAFAERELARMRPVGELDRDRLNVNGGAIALGHPVGASGGRLVLTLLLEMSRRDVELGLVTLCIGGGQGAAVVLERA
jgi:acetyl-CoA C-acetyltransferase/acetyl-CoA acyltransferase